MRHHDHEELAGQAAGGVFVPASPGTVPDPDGPGNAAWQRVKGMLADIHADLDAQRRRN